VYYKVHHSIGSFENIMQHCVVLNAPSKTFNIAGLNTSYAIIPNRHLRHQYIAKQDKSGITNGNPFGIEALISAYEKGDAWLDALKKHLSDNIAYVTRFLKDTKLPIVPVKTEGTFLMWLDCKGLSMSQEMLTHFFVYEAKLGLNNGMDFGKQGEGFMRLNVGTSQATLQEAMHRLSKAYRSKV